MMMDAVKVPVHMGTIIPETGVSQGLSNKSEYLFTEYAWKSTGRL